MKPSFQTSRQALTLVEVVVVTVIIIILSILVVTWIRPRREARMVSCANNVRQIGMACKQYAVDNNDAFPSGTVFNARAVDCFTLLTGSYLATGKIYNCPSDRTAIAGSTFTCGTNSYCYVTASQTGRIPLTEANAATQPLILDKGLEGTPNPPVIFNLQSLFSQKSVGLGMVHRFRG
jgi:competence protein ComGC